MRMRWCLPCVLLLCRLGYGQAAPAFDAASVRPSKDGAAQDSNVPLDVGTVYSFLGASDSRTSAGGLFVATHQPLWRYISFAYKLSEAQELSLRFNAFSGAPRSGAPFWVTGGFDSAPAFFDISARASADTTIDGMRAMMRTLLAERFHLAVHTTTAETVVFALVQVKQGIAGPKLRVHPASDDCTKPVADLPSRCGVIAHVASASPGQHYGGRAVPMELFATSIPGMTGIAATPRPVVDRTGLSGLYDLNLDWTHDMNPDAGVVVDNAAAIHDAMKSELGLELKSARAPMQFLVVDRVEKPGEN